MKLPAQTRTKLLALLERGALPASQCGQSFRRFVSSLLESGVLGKKRSGAGLSIVVNNQGALRDFCLQQFPEVTLPVGAGSRIASVGRYRDTKALPNNENEIISLRVWKDEAFLKNGKPVGAAAATAAHGLFSFLLARNTPCDYELRGPCALVEGPVVFELANQLDLGVGAAVYGHGRISKRAIEWLTHSADSDFSVLHLPDYDPTGLLEFQRLQSRLGKRAILYLPSDLEARFAEFAKRGLLKKIKSQAMLAQLRRSTLPAISCVVGLIDRYNAGLEQEALLINLRS